MPVTPSYPGVYVEEIPSGVRTITGVATSITAFIGFASRGLVNEPVRIQNFGDFERQFGGLSINSTMSYAVQQYFLNGGMDAIIVRLSNSGPRAAVELKAGTEKLVLEALEPGKESRQLKVTVNFDGVSNPEEKQKFNLIVTSPKGETEPFNDISITQLKDSIARSKWVRVKPDSSLPANRLDPVKDEPFKGRSGKANTATISLNVSKDSEGKVVTQKLILKAASEGAWGNGIQVSVDYDTAEPTKTFNLKVEFKEDGQVVAREMLRNLSMDDQSSRYVVEILNTQSGLVRVDSLPEGGGRPEDKKEPIQADGKGSNGDPVIDDRFHVGSEADKTGLYALEKADLFNLLCIPPVTRTIDITSATWITALKYCEQRRAMLIVDPPLDWASKDNATNNLSSFLEGWSDKKNAALFFPRVKLPDPLKENRLEVFPPSAVIAGIFARTDANRGVWKAPAGIEATLTGVRGLSVSLTDGENGQLNPLGVNCLRNFPVYGNVIWGARTLEGDDRLASEWKYIPVRRLALFLQESLYRGPQWVVFEPNDEPLWSQIRLNIGAFMNNLFKQGAFQGKTPKEAYLVKCDSETTTQYDIDRGIVNIVIGFAPLKPAEFVILKFQQMTRESAT
jgi:hypothetical protein